MKNILILTLSIASFTLAVLAGENSTGATANATNRFVVNGMHCDGCAQGLTEELRNSKGVATVSVSLTNKLATIAFDTNQVTSARLIKVIREAGFKATLAKP